jgi:hypothetical protein
MAPRELIMTQEISRPLKVFSPETKRESKHVTHRVITLARISLQITENFYSVGSKQKSQELSE